jgi:hypothetical protein
MNVLLNVKNKKATCTGLVGLFLLGSFLSGCDPSGGAPGASGGRPGGGAPGSRSARKPSQPAAKKPAQAAAPTMPTPGKAAGPVAAIPGAPGSPTGLTTPAKNEATPSPDKPLLGFKDEVEQAGNIIKLASAIINAGTNPFLDRLPKPLVATADNGNATPDQPAADPFEGINLMGIIYHPKNPLALISTGEGGKSQLIRKGADIVLSGNLAQVTSITRDGIEFQLQGGNKEKRTFSLPNIIEYAAVGKDASSSSAGTETGGSVGMNDLSNLKKLFGGNDPADVVLKEP